MTYTFKLAKRIAMIRALAFVLPLSVSTGCDSTNRFDPTTDPPPVSDPFTANAIGPNSTPAAATLPPPLPPTPFSGVPFGPDNIPTSAMPSFSGAVRSVSPANVVAITEAARDAGARIILRLSGNGLRNPDGTFSLSQWKAAISRYTDVDFSSVSDGTIAGHMLVQRPHDPANWGGQPISYETLEEMARYSRQLWPGLPTIVKAPPSWLAAKPTPWQYLDASSVVYYGSAGDAGAWVGRQTRAAGRAGLGLLVGINVLKGGTSARELPAVMPGTSAVSASQLESWGSLLLAPSQVCGLIMFHYDSAYFARPDVKGAVATLAAQARTHASTSCRLRS